MMHAPFRHRQVLLATLISTSIYGTAVAEDVQIPDISVTASPLFAGQNLNTTIMSAEELQTLAPATSDTASLLRNTPGLNLQKSGGVSSLPVIHGLADDRLRIKVDGMDLISACGNHMNPALSYIDSSNVSSAVVFTTLSPVSSGGDSIGGTILVDSPAPEFAKVGEGLLTKGEVGAFYRSNGNAQGGNISATVAGEKMSLTYSGSTAKSDNYDAGDGFKSQTYKNDIGDSSLDDDEVGSTFYKATNQSISMALNHENHLVEFKYGEQDIPYQAWVNQRMDMTGNDSKQYNLDYEGQFDWGDLETRVYKERTRHKMQFDDDKLFYYVDGIPCAPGTLELGNKGCALGMPMDTRGNNTGFTVKADIPLSSRDNLVIGAELQEYRLDDWWEPSGRGMWPDTFVNINNGQRDRTALFAEWEAKWNPQWQTQLGIRGENVDMDADEVQGYNSGYDADANAFNTADRDITDHNIDLTALAHYTVNDMTTVEFGYAQKTRSPNLYERYTWSTGSMAMLMINWYGDGNGYVGNLELEPEISHTISATFDWHDADQKDWGFKVAPYYTYIDDYIDATVLREQDDWLFLQFVNQSAKIYGLDLSGYVSLAEGTPYGSFIATGLVNYVRGKNQDTHDNLYNMMPLNARLAVIQNKGNWSNTVEFEVVDEKDDVSDTRNEIETSGYGLLHLRTSYKWKNISIDAGIENVFDKFYRDPLGGTYLGEGMTMTAKASMGGVLHGDVVPGMGRSVYVGVNYKF